MTVNLNREEPGLVVAHPADAETGIQLPQGTNQTIEVVPFPAHNAVGGLSQAFGPVGSGSGSACEEVVDAVVVQDPDQADQVMMGAGVLRRREGRLPAQPRVRPAMQARSPENRCDGHRAALSRHRGLAGGRRAMPSPTPRR